jgi:hypothetical protein
MRTQGSNGGELGLEIFDVRGGESGYLALFGVVTGVHRCGRVEIILDATSLLVSILEGTRHLLRMEFPTGVFDVAGATTKVALEMASVFISCGAM